MKKSELKELIKECITEMTLTGYKLHFKIPFNIKDKFKELAKKESPWGARFDADTKTWNVMFKTRQASEEFLKNHKELEQYYIKSDEVAKHYGNRYKGLSYTHTSLDGDHFAGFREADPYQRRDSDL